MQAKIALLKENIDNSLKKTRVKWKFHRLRDKLEHYLAGCPYEALKVEDIDNFYTEYQTIWNDLSQSWVTYRKQEKF